MNCRNSCSCSVRHRVEVALLGWPEVCELKTLMNDWQHVLSCSLSFICHGGNLCVKPCSPCAIPHTFPPRSTSKERIICLYFKCHSMLKQAPYEWSAHWNCLTSFTLNRVMMAYIYTSHAVSVTNCRYDEITSFLGCRHASASGVQSVQSKCPAEWRTPTKVTIFIKQQLLGMANFLY